METVGTRIEGFKDPVCNSFVPTVHQDQLCFKIDLERFRNNKDIENQLEYGLDMILDYNENRQFVRDYKKGYNDVEKQRRIFHAEKQETVSIHLDTISKINIFSKTFSPRLILDPVTLPGEGEYNLNILKEVKVTDSFMGLDEDVRGCQNQEHYLECTTNNFIEEMRQQCGCLPLSIRSSNFQVNYKSMVKGSNFDY